MRYPLLALIVVLSGCASNVWVGTNPTKDIQECRLDAGQKYPPMLYSEQVSAGYTSPKYTSCDNMGGYVTCSTTGGVYTPPTTMTSDANSTAREDYINYCMTQRGNRLMSESDYENYRKLQLDAKSSTQEHTESKDKDSQGTGKIPFWNTSIGNSNTQKMQVEETETPTQKRIRLRRECRRKLGQDSPLCDDDYLVDPGKSGN